MPKFKKNGNEKVRISHKSQGQNFFVHCGPERTILHRSRWILISGQRPRPSRCSFPHHCFSLAPGKRPLVLLLKIQSDKSSDLYKVVEQLYLEKAGWREAPALATLAALVNYTPTSLLELKLQSLSNVVGCSISTFFVHADCWPGFRLGGFSWLLWSHHCFKVDINDSVWISIFPLRCLLGFFLSLLMLLTAGQLATAALLYLQVKSHHNCNVTVGCVHEPTLTPDRRWWIVI